MRKMMNKMNVMVIVLMSCLAGCELYHPPTALDSMEDTSWKGDIYIEGAGNGSYGRTYGIIVRFDGTDRGVYRIRKDLKYEEKEYLFNYSAGKDRLSFEAAPPPTYDVAGSAKGEVELTSAYWLRRQLELKGSMTIGHTRRTIRINLSRTNNK